MPIQYIPVNLAEDLAICLQFRKDAWLASYGTMVGFSEEETTQWFHDISGSDSHYFLHVWYQQHIIGQLEFKSPEFKS